MVRDDGILVEHIAHGHRQLRVAMVTETYPPEVNGVAMTVGRMVSGLRDRGHSVQLIRPRQHAGEAPDRGFRFEERLAGGLSIPNYPGLRFGLPSKGYLSRLWSLDRPDVIHVATEGPLGWSAVSAARKLRLPVSSGFHTDFEAYARHYGVGWLKEPIARYLKSLHNRTDATLVPTRALAESLERAGYRGVRVLARGVDTRWFHPGRRSAELRARWGVGESGLVVLHVGRMAAEKNLDLVLRSFERIRAMRPDARMLFVGGGPLAGNLASRHPEFLFAGVRHGEDLAAHYASADVFLFPSLTETYGNVTAEALASGLAVIAYRCAAAADLIEDGVHGLLAPMAEDAAFAAAAARAAADDPLRASLRGAAPAAVAGLDWERIHDRFSAVLAEIVDRRSQDRQARGGFLVAPD